MIDIDKIDVGKINADEDVSREVFFHFLRRYRGFIVWSISLALFIWIFVQAREVMSLLLLSYGLAVLFDPLITRIANKRLGPIQLTRGMAVIGLQALMFVVVLVLILIAIPQLIEQYQHLMEVLPGYLERLTVRATDFATLRLGMELPQSREEYLAEIRNSLSSVGIDQIKVALRTLGVTLLSGYSVTLTVLNLTLVPFFIYYIAVELPQFHHFVVKHMPHEIRNETLEILRQIMRHVRAFFRGQLTVSAIMAVLYWLTLALVGLPSAFLVGMLSGFLNIVPYLGLALGLSLATIITLVTEPDFSQLLLVWGAFGLVQLAEGFYLTPRIVGEQVGIHSLTVIVALIVGGQLFGFAGLILAIPLAAALKVLAQRLLLAGRDEVIITG